MYLRFTTTAIDDDSHKPRGLFTEAYLLLNSGDLTPEEWKVLRELLDWFSDNLCGPPKKFIASRTIFSFRSDAHDCIGRLWEIVALLREHGHHVVIHKCRKLGNVCFSDRLQVAAFPSDLDDRIIEN
jgi:hypothetical protein